MSTGKIIGIVILIAGVLGIIYGIYEICSVIERMNDRDYGKYVSLDFGDFFPIIAGTVGLITGLNIYKKAK